MSCSIRDDIIMALNQFPHWTKNNQMCVNQRKITLEEASNLRNHADQIQYFEMKKIYLETATRYAY